MFSKAWAACYSYFKPSAVTDQPHHEACCLGLWSIHCVLFWSSAMWDCIFVFQILSAWLLLLCTVKMYFKLSSLCVLCFSICEKWNPGSFCPARMVLQAVIWLTFVTRLPLFFIFFSGFFSVASNSCVMSRAIIVHSHHLSFATEIWIPTFISIWYHFSVSLFAESSNRNGSLNSSCLAWTGLKYLQVYLLSSITTIFCCNAYSI